MTNRTAALMVVLICTSAASAQAELIIWPENGHCYEVRLRPDGIDWQAAENECEANAGTLASITPEAENEFVHGLLNIPGINGVWLGGFQPAGAPEPAGDWTWVTGEPFTFSRWEVGEPNDGFGEYEEDAISYFTWIDEGPRATWNDIPRSEALTAYVFETDFCDLSDAPAHRIESGLIVFPNPTVGTVTYGFDVVQPQRTRVTIVDAGGRLARCILDTRLAPGRHDFVWRPENGFELRSGVYWLRLEAGPYSESRRFVVLK